MATPFRALVCDLRTDDILDSFPLDHVRFDDRIGGGGTLTARVELGADADLAFRTDTALLPARTAVWIQRDGDLWWGGVVWRTTRHTGDDGPEFLELHAATWDSYLDHRILYAGLPGDPAEQLALARELVEHAQAQPGGDIGISVAPFTASGIERQPAYDDFDLVHIGEALRGLAAQDDGFEWHITSAREPGSGYRMKRLDLGYPVLASDLPDLRLDDPGAVLGYAYTNDGARRATFWRSRGARSGTGRLMSHIWEVADVVDPAETDTTTWPRLDGAAELPGCARREELDTAAKQALRRAWDPSPVLDVTVRLDERPTPSLIGRHVRLPLGTLGADDARDGRLRVVAAAVETPAGDEPETVRLTLGAAA
ncbi:hypothetical protein [Yinghuangia seranimata]|uniref:hypothetical protein n=1 Tax=Yinghuangia seranimata TaxID=408067 RepID=UPI00248BECB3|nr:hypothetical protein [Yinghuangia seranimata]MDI2127412.1 hypothetical protein [Yinghuangia seranimata]